LSLHQPVFVSTSASICLYISVYLSLHQPLFVSTLASICLCISLYLSLHQRLFFSTSATLCLYISLYLSLHQPLFVSTLASICLYISLYLSLYQPLFVSLSLPLSLSIYIYIYIYIHASHHITTVWRKQTLLAATVPGTVRFMSAAGNVAEHYCFGKNGHSFGKVQLSACCLETQSFYLFYNCIYNLHLQQFYNSPHTPDHRSIPATSRSDTHGQLAPVPLSAGDNSKEALLPHSRPTADSGCCSHLVPLDQLLNLWSA
jgi:hypothetical protein